MDIISAIASAARTHRHVEHEGPNVERDFEVGEFDQLEIAAPFDVDIETGEDCSVHAVGPEVGARLVPRPGRR